MIKKTTYLSLLAFIFGMFYASSIYGQSVKSSVEKYLDNYKREDADIARSTLKGCDVDDEQRQITITIGGGFQEQFFTEEIVNSIYNDIRETLPKSKRNYNLMIVTEGHAIEDLIPNFFRKGRMDESRLWKKTNKEKQWVKNISRPYSAPLGLDGNHISLWQSHGRYFREAKNEWVWQRPRLFCTTEDLFSQTFVIPYIIPMLQNAGANVFTPRERDWQSLEVIVDNDAPNKNGIYIEGKKSKKARFQWHTTKEYGFALNKDVYLPLDTPFTDGTARYVPTTQSKKEECFASWVPDIPETGSYAVYVAYQTTPNSVDDAHYSVYHKGGITEFSVNQRMGGGTWVYLGTFEFEKGVHDYGMVVLSNIAEKQGMVTSDAVRFGGGMGNLARGLSFNGGSVSGMPRWAEAAKYSAQWYGFSPEIHTTPFGSNDYSNDINTRSRSLNYLSGGSIYNPEREGMNVPMEVQVAFHTDAGFKRDDNLVGSLSIYRTEHNDGLTAAGLDRYVSRDLSSMLLTNLSRDLKKYNWKVRQLWNRDYGEAREPSIPACILEMLSHQNFADMRLGYDPQFKFDFCRSVYKTIVKFVATEHKRNYVIQPLPVQDFYIKLNEKKSTAELHWNATEDSSEPTAMAEQYIVYTRKGHEGFDNGTLVKDNSYSVKLDPDVIYSFRISAVNKGGESFPSETLAAYIAPNNTGTVLIVNAFTRLEGPAQINTATMQGFDLDKDPGVQYGAFAGFCGKQLAFDKSYIGKENSSGLGYSGSELEGKVVMGNTFDYVFQHGTGVAQTQKHSFTSTSESALINGHIDMNDYKMADVIYGVQRVFNTKTSTLLNSFTKQGGRVLVSGANLFQGSGFNCPQLHCLHEGTLTDKNINGISGCGLKFNIYRKMNDKSYSVPSPEILKPGNDAFLMLTYDNGAGAGVAYDGNDYKSVTLGFPIESITSFNTRNMLMEAIVKFLCK